MKEIADTGLIVALLTRNDPHHAWALDAFRKHSPFSTCDAVLAEAGFRVSLTCAKSVAAQYGALYCEVLETTVEQEQAE